MVPSATRKCRYVFISWKDAVSKNCYNPWVIIIDLDYNFGANFESRTVEKIVIIEERSNINNLIKVSWLEYPSEGVRDLGFHGNTSGINGVIWDFKGFLGIYSGKVYGFLGSIYSSPLKMR